MWVEREREKTDVDACASAAGGMELPQTEMGKEDGCRFGGEVYCFSDMFSLRCLLDI